MECLRRNLPGHFKVRRGETVLLRVEGDESLFRRVEIHGRRASLSSTACRAVLCSSHLTEISRGTPHSGRSMT